MIASSFFVSFRIFRILLILVVVIFVGSWSSCSYVLVSFGRFIALDMYSFLSMITVVRPLSAGTMTMFSSFFRLMRTCLFWLVKPFCLDRCNRLCVTWCRMSFVDSSGSMLDFNVDCNEAMKFNPTASCVLKFISFTSARASSSVNCLFNTILTHLFSSWLHCR